jgi:hypothetical protein
MGNVGRCITDRAGSYCRIALQSGDTIIVKHEKRGPGGWLTIERLKLLGFSSDRLFACNLDSPHGQAILAKLTRGAEPGTPAATPLGAAVAFVKDAETLRELKTRCAALMSGR